MRVGKIFGVGLDHELLSCVACSELAGSRAATTTPDWVLNEPVKRATAPSAETFIRTFPVRETSLKGCCLAGQSFLMGS
jgi:hypothetical protein